MRLLLKFTLMGIREKGKNYVAPNLYKYKKKGF